MKRIKVFVVDDSAIVRSLLSEKLSKHPRIEVIGSAIDPFVARDKIVKEKPDLITLDIEMPRMDGLTFLKYLMKYYPVPVIVVSSLTDGSNEASVQALELGALDIVPKPGGSRSVESVVDLLIERILKVGEVRRENLSRVFEDHELRTTPVPKKVALSTIRASKKLIAVGASTGGPAALETLFRGFDRSFPPTVAVIHMPEKFTKSYAERLNSFCEVTVKEAENNEVVQDGTVYIAAGNFHLAVKAAGKDSVLKVFTGPRIHGQRPAVDILFESVAENIGRNALGVILTGMGRDGADGLLRMRQTGARTIAQDENSCIVFGMPREAIKLGAAETVLPLADISKKLRTMIAEGGDTE